MRIYKTCSKCKKEKLSIEFSKHKNRKDGLNGWCKLCNKENTKIWYKNNNSEHRRAVRERKQIYKEKAQRYIIQYFKSHPCIDCGESNPVLLDFDHRNPQEKNFSIGKLVVGVVGIDLTKLCNEIEKCDVRCANCHRLKTARENNHVRYRIWKDSQS